MRKFKQMTLNDRIKMEALLNAGHSKAEVAEQLHFHRSNIYRLISVFRDHIFVLNRVLMYRELKKKRWKN